MDGQKQQTPELSKTCEETYCAQDKLSSTFWLALMLASGFGFLGIRPAAPRFKAEGQKGGLQMNSCAGLDLNVVGEGNLRLDRHEALRSPFHCPHDAAVLELASGERHQRSQG